MKYLTLKSACELVVEKTADGQGFLVYNRGLAYCSRPTVALSSAAGTVSPPAGTLAWGSTAGHSFALTHTEDVARRKSARWEVSDHR